MKEMHLRRTPNKVQPSRTITAQAMIMNTKVCVPPRLARVVSIITPLDTGALANPTADIVCFRFDLLVRGLRDRVETVTVFNMANW